MRVRCGTQKHQIIFGSRPVFIVRQSEKFLCRFPERQIFSPLCDPGSEFQIDQCGENQRVYLIERVLYKGQISPPGKVIQYGSQENHLLSLLDRKERETYNKENHFQRRKNHAHSGYQTAGP